MTIELFGFTGIEIAVIIISIANIGVLLGLLYIYIGSYRQIKIGFTTGIILFAAILLLRNIFDITYLIMTGNMLNNSHDLTKDIIGGIIQFIALTILLKITWDY
ncbi:hypothetical protein [Methanobacterium sp.]|jgi:flagellar biosynthesis protein FliR|uniref:hypothetical protein n=1 Tax=Methanobacterium sp. TaxID=2164 RepID=UPI00315852F2